MFHVKNHKQLHIFDPWAYLGNKRRKELDKSWAGLFRQHILPFLPVDRLRHVFHASNGRPSKELYSMLGLMVLQQMHDLTDEQAVEHFAFNIKWQYALDITNSSDAYSYVSLRSIWKMRDLLTRENLYESLFHETSARLAKTFKANFRQQRLDSVHIRSNMRHLGRISLFVKTLKSFLINLKRHHRHLFDRLDSTLRARYLDKRQEAVFALVKPSASGVTLNQIATDIFTLIQHCSTNRAIGSMTSYKLLVRLFTEQCLVENRQDGTLVKAKANMDVPSDSLQNPADPDAGYSGHKGQGYSVQVMETYSDDKSTPHLPLITHVAVQSADNHDAHALLPALEDVQTREMSPAELLADTAYGSDDNVVEAANRYAVEVVAPLKNNPDGLSISDFTFSESGHILKCPQGQQPKHTRFRKRFSAAFDRSTCHECSQFAQCPAVLARKAAYVRYTIKELRIAKRRGVERSSTFRQRYRFRAGVEATMAEFDRVTGVKKLRVRGLAAVAYAVYLKALGLNIKRAAKYCKEVQKRSRVSLGHIFFLFLRAIRVVRERFAALFSKICAALGPLGLRTYFCCESLV